MVQYPQCWRASYALGHPKQRTFKFDWMKSLCFGCPRAQPAPLQGGFCTNVTVSWKLQGLLEAKDGSDPLACGRKDQSK